MGPAWEDRADRARRRPAHRVRRVKRAALRLSTATILLVTAVACGDDDDSASPPTTAVAVTSGTAAGSETPPPVTTDTPASAPAAGVYPPQPAGVPFPAADWPTGPLPGGVDQAAIDDAVATAMGPANAGGRVQSVVVIHGGQLVYERYHPRDGPDQVMSSYSVAKSFTSAIVGLLIGDGVLSLDEHPPRPEWPAGDPRQAITLRQLLEMSSGLQWKEDATIVGLVIQWLGSPSAAHLVAERPLATEPGTTFNYSTGSSALIAGIAADALGGCPALDTYIHQRLLDPLGITTEQITKDGGGCFVGGFGMDMTTRDFARFGLLYLRGGQWDGQQLLPAGWVDQSRVPSATNPEYGLHWWLDADGFSAEGLFRQRIVVVPGEDLVIATNSTNGGDPDPMVHTIVEEFRDA
jgi:CubicO group peptidase (beta-lactamase class C family)